MTRSPEPGTREPAQRVMRWLEWGFEWGLLLSRLLILIPVIVLVASAAAAFVYDAAVFIQLFGDVIAQPFPLGNRIGRLLLVIDLFLVGATLLIAGIGFYELFISRVDVGGKRGMPGWLVMNDLNDLKARVVSMLVLVTAVSFVDVAVEFHSEGGHDILFLGVAVALVIAALTAFLRFGAGGREGS
ncbi:MAG: YqhA family protein [Micromonosporaceae bacterium]